MNLIQTHIGVNPPNASNVAWIRPLKNGGFGFYTWLNNKWSTLKLIDTKDSRTPQDDTPLDPTNESDNFYTKDQIDTKIGDIETLLAAI